MSVAHTATELENALAKSRLARPIASRLMLAIVDMCGGRRRGGVVNPRFSLLLGPLLTDLVTSAEHDIRQRLAEKARQATGRRRT